MRGSNSVSIQVKDSDLDALLAEMGEAAQNAVRPASQAGAQVLYEAVLRNVQAMPTSKTGNLRRAIYQAYSKDNSSEHSATYHVSWRTGRERDENGKALPAGGPKNVAPHGHLVEYGYMQRYATYMTKDGQFRPQIRPEKQGTPKPKKGKKGQAARDAYYVLAENPKQIPAHPFVRPAQARFGEALDAAEALVRDRMAGVK